MNRKQMAVYITAEMSKAQLYTNCIINSSVGSSLSSCLIDGGRRTNIYCENIVTRGGCRNSWGVLLDQPTAEVNFAIKLNNCECLNAICITIRTCRTININTKYY